MLITNTNIVAPWVMRKAECSISSDCTAIGQMFEDTLVAGVMFEHYTGPSIVGTIAVEKGYAMSKEFVRAIFDYPFNQLKCKQILAHAAADNEPSRGLLEHMGFKIVAEIPGVFEEDTSMVIYCLKREDCRFLESKDGQKE